MKFDMGAMTLGQLTTETAASTQDLAALVRRLVAAAEPLQQDFNGAGRVAFDRFKGQTDLITAELNAALAAIVGGQHDMDQAFQTGDEQSSENATRAMGTADFDAARFAAR